MSKPASLPAISGKHTWIAALLALSLLAAKPVLAEEKAAAHGEPKASLKNDAAAKPLELSPDAPPGSLPVAPEPDPIEAAAHNAAGNEYFAQKDYPKAQAEYEKAINLAADPAIPSYNRGLALLLQGKQQEAEDIFAGLAAAKRTDGLDAASSLNAGNSAFRQAQEAERQSPALPPMMKTGQAKQAEGKSPKELYQKAGEWYKKLLAREREMQKLPAAPDQDNYADMARRNLELAQREIKRIEKQPPPPPQDKQKQQDKKNDQKDQQDKQDQPGDQNKQNNEPDKQQKPNDGQGQSKPKPDSANQQNSQKSQEQEKQSEQKKDEQQGSGSKTNQDDKKDQEKQGQQNKPDKKPDEKKPDLQDNQKDKASPQNGEAADAAPKGELQDQEMQSLFSQLKELQDRDREERRKLKVNPDLKVEKDW